MMQFETAYTMASQYLWDVYNANCEIERYSFERRGVGGNFNQITKPPTLDEIFEAADKIIDASK